MVSLSPRQIEVFIQNFFSIPARQQEEAQPDREQQAEKGQVLLRDLRQKPALLGLARIPLMLALLCRLAWEGEALPDRRVEVYKQCLLGLMWKWRKKEDREDPEDGEDLIEAEVRTEQKLTLLARLAFELLQASPQADAWELGELSKWLQKVLGRPQADKQVTLVPDKQIDELIGELVRNGVLAREGERDRAPSNSCIVPCAGPEHTRRHARHGCSPARLAACLGAVACPGSPDSPPRGDALARRRAVGRPVYRP